MSIKRVVPVETKQVIEREVHIEKTDKGGPGEKGDHFVRLSVNLRRKLDLFGLKETASHIDPTAIAKDICDKICDGILCDAIVCDKNFCDSICDTVCDQICDQITDVA